MSDIKIGVLGAGIVGLSTALEAQKYFRNVEICADKFNADTTSFVAAGLFRPGTNFSGPTEEITRKWISDAYEYWDNIRASSEASNCGVTQQSGYIFSSTSPTIVRNHFLEKVVPVYRPASTEELKLCPGDWKYGSFFTTILTESRLFLPWAAQSFVDKGGRIIEKNVKSLGEFSKNYDITFNCTGLGAKYLCNDNKLVPMRGQVLKVEAPWVKTFFYGDYDTYVIPGFNSVTLGGCRQYDSYDLKVNKYDSLAIRERCEALLPSLVKSPVKSELVGLRPHRDPVRVEKEILSTIDKNCKIVHNYGHGGYGVTTAPGTAIYAVKLAREMHLNHNKL